MPCASEPERWGRALCNSRKRFKQPGPSIDERIEKAYRQLKEGYFEDAVEAFSDCLLLSPGEARFYYGRGMANFNLKNWEASLLDFRKARELDPENLENWIALATSLAAANRIYEAIEVFENLLANNPRYIRGHIQFAQLYYKLGVIAKGHEQLDIALGSRPALSERKTIEELKSRQLALDKRRYYRPDFEALHRQNPSSPGFLERIKSFFSRKGA